MKVCILILIISMVHVHASSFGQQVTLDIKNGRLVDVLDEIQKQTGYEFLYNNSLINKQKRVTIKANHKNFKEVLQEFLSERNLTYELNLNTVLIMAKAASLPVAPSSAVILQRRKIRGVVSDVKGMPLESVTVSVKGTNIGTKTDAQGQFALEIEDQHKVLQFSLVGFQSSERNISTSNQLNVTLEPAVSDLEEAVVVAYGKQRKISVVGAISSVSPQQLKTPVAKLSSSLAGQMAGVVTVQGSGEPGSATSFWIRGVSSFAGSNSPLILVDGIERPMDLVDPEDVESFSVLKDATATAVYGVRGANGIVIITTKRGKKSAKPTINARVERGMLEPTRLPKLANATQWLDYYNDINFEASGKVPLTQEEINKYVNKVDPDVYPNVDWMQEIFKKRTSNERLNVNVTGGGDFIKYYVSGSYMKENGIFQPRKTSNYDPSVNFDRINFRSNVDIKLSPSTEVNLNLSNQFETKNRLGLDLGTMYETILHTTPVAIPTQFSNGAYTMSPYYFLNTTGYSKDFWNNAQSLVGVTQDFSELITPGLRANVKFSWDAKNSTSLDRRKNPITYYVDKTNARDSDGNLILKDNGAGSDYFTLKDWHSGERAINFESSLMYDRLFAEKHRFGGLFLFSMRERTNNFPENNYIDALPYRNTGIASRLTYSYQDRYFIEGNFGYNGSENFAPKKRFGFFPSLAMGYVLSNEPFFESILPVISFLKIRGSIGKIGSDKIDGKRRFAYNSEMEDRGGYSFGIGGQKPLTGIATGYPGNPLVAWESALKRNIGLELTLFNKLTIQTDYFAEKRDGIYIPQESVPSVVGVNVKPLVNIGQMENRGIEGSLEFNHHQGDFGLQIRGNITYNRNKKLFDDKPVPVWAYQSDIGQRWGQQRGLIALGLFQSDEEIAHSPVQKYGDGPHPGDLKYRDINGDGQITEQDMVAIGDTDMPQLTYGFGTSVSWRGFDIAAFFHGVGEITRIIKGGPLYGQTGNIWNAGQIYSDVADHRWSADNPNPDAIYPRMSLNIANNSQASTWWQRDMSFIRLKNLEFGYTLPKRWIEKWKMSTMRFYAQGVNVFTFSKFKLWDPELETVSGSGYPQMRVFNIGLSVIF
ncbi:TonB-dependent receptor [Sphingobacterium siyangense]|uniref:TonB-dependent receptor n=1 Tax=Sphingobacterium siyangense TaxID=459529 RepID=UPI0028B20D00|nr:TonB-dependent receptor [Sphingobacterium siyangense]